MAAKGTIIHECVAPAAGEKVGVFFSTKNTGNEAASFAFIFCASSAASPDCDLLQFGSAAFVMNPNQSVDHYQEFKAPDMPYSYIIELQRWQD